MIRKGDKLRCIDADSAQVTLGKTYEALGSEFMGIVLIQTDAPRARFAYCRVDRFEVLRNRDAEVRVRSATGGEKGSKPAQLGAIDARALLVLAEVSGMGAAKYAPYNYLKGYDWSLSFNAMQRHALQFWAGEDLDPESGLPHMAHAAWHGLALVSFLMRELGTDDRFGATGTDGTVAQ